MPAAATVETTATAAAGSSDPRDTEQHPLPPRDRSGRADGGFGVPGKRTLTEQLFARGDAATQLTAHQIDNNLDLWLPDNLGADEDRANIQAIWHAILAGNQQFTFDQPIDKSFGKDTAVPAEVTRQIKVEVISELGRLMSQPAGRKLIGMFFKTDEASVVNFQLAQLYRIEPPTSSSVRCRSQNRRSRSVFPRCRIKSTACGLGSPSIAIDRREMATIRWRTMCSSCRHAAHIARHTQGGSR